MPIELETQLGEYAHWLADAYDLDVMPPHRRTGRPVSMLRQVTPEEPDGDTIDTDGDTIDTDGDIDDTADSAPTRVVPARRGRVPLWAAAAAAVAALVAGLVIRRSDNSPADDVVVTTTEAPRPESTVVDIGERIDPVVPVGEVLWSGRIGTGFGELGGENCDGCARPWPPVALDDGRLLIADVVNHKWVIVDGGLVEEVTLGDWVLYDQPVVVGRTVVAIATPLGDDTARPSLLRYRLDDLTAPESVEAIDPDLTTQLFQLELQVRNGVVQLARTPDAGPDLAVGGSPDVGTWGDADATMQIVLADVGHTTRWQFPAGWRIEVPTSSVRVLADGTVLAWAWAGQGAGSSYFLELTPAGDVLASTGLRSDTFNLGYSIADGHLVVLEIDGETFEVVRYPLRSAGTTS